MGNILKPPIRVAVEDKLLGEGTVNISSYKRKLAATNAIVE